VEYTLRIPDDDLRDEITVVQTIQATVGQLVAELLSEAAARKIVARRKRLGIR
jgi:hypothetical protein